MNAIYYYSASTNVFYEGARHADFVANGRWPHDAVPVDAAIVEEFSRYRPEHRRRPGPDGLPYWQAMPSVDKAQLQAAQVRARRDQLLRLSDHHVLPDRVRSTQAKQDWYTYRQALRDITAQAKFPEAVHWPQPPVDQA